MNFEKLCRTCSSENELISLYIESSILIVNMLTEVVDLKVRKDDNYPQGICNQCLEKLISAYEFKKHCQNVQINFEQCLQTRHLKEENDIGEPDIVIVKEEHQFNDFNWDHNEKPIVVTEKSQPMIDSEKLLHKPKVDSNKLIIKNFTRKKKSLSTCNICNRKVTQLDRHLRSHTKERPFKCEICEKQFATKDWLQSHVKIHSGDRSHVCELCGLSFVLKRYLTTHLKNHCFVVSTACIDPLSADKDLLKCIFCSRTFQLSKYLRQHLRLAHAGNLEPTGNGEFLCEQCNEKFDTEEILTTHKLLHTKKPYLCNQCGKSFMGITGLQLHIQTHTGKKPFKCSACEKEFVRKKDYDNHKLIHTGEKPFKCDICKQSFRQRAHLTRHNLIHTGEKFYKCTFCDKSFALKDNLNTHTRIHTGKTPFICSICNKGFTNSSNMKHHKKTHLPC